MKIVSLSYYQATLEISPDDCASLGRFLRAAEAAGAFDHPESELDRALCGTLGAAFESLAVACALLSNLRPDDVQPSAEILAGLGLGNLVTLPHLVAEVG